ncbi:NifU family protein [Candidatus Anaplasma sp. TIGMIC]|uniref:NifU family protein n=1 Tax=Candidatus Anaplasma sp. TIGMIC TaxID=3020713 RepID=UPI00232FE8E9|nr:NifU family protein [Candidatus Anaplasma sp. TIGMIC]MDB1135578.1 NifU family protein [Candidatus Anaplasma sp. TIGMIC]
MFIQIENTPNPDTLKFLLSPEMVGIDSGAEFLNADDAQSSPLARLLFEVDGVEKVFFGGDFVSITKAGSVLWDSLRPEVLVVMTDYFALRASGDDQDQGSIESEEKEFFDEADTEIVQQVKELIENYVRPAVAQDGGDIKFRGYKDGVVFVKLRGACSGCPSAAVTLKDGVYGMLSYYIPAIKGVESI